MAINNEQQNDSFYTKIMVQYNADQLSRCLELNSQFRLIVFNGLT